MQPQSSNTPCLRQVTCNLQLLPHTLWLKILPPIAEKAAVPLSIHFHSFTLISEEGKTCFIFVIKRKQEENRSFILQVSEVLLSTRSSCVYHDCLPKNRNIPRTLPTPSALAFISLFHLISPERSRRSPAGLLAAAGLLKHLPQLSCQPFQQQALCL